MKNLFNRARALVATAFVALTLVGVGTVARSAPAAANTCSTIPLPAGHAYAVKGTPNGHYGATAADRYNIQKIQRIINKWSGRNRLAVDGVYGSGTRSAVIAFQRDLNARGVPIGEGIVADGVYGARTWSRAWSDGWGGFQC